MLKSVLERVMILCGSLLISLVVMEIGIRVLGEWDQEGQFYFMDQAIRPYSSRDGGFQEELQIYLDNVEVARLQYHPVMGWVLRPDNADAQVNSAGIRSDIEYERENSSDIYRIAIFGDSFTYSDEVSYEESWGYQLEALLEAKDHSLEILNFGTPAYGMDQAYLRWREVGQQYQPDLVIFGFQPENLERNINVFRAIYEPTGTIPFAKPRFVLNADTMLELVNVPVISPDTMLTEHDELLSHPLMAYEAHHYTISGPAQDILLRSKFMSVVYHFYIEAMHPVWRHQEKFELGYRIVDLFGSEVEAAGSEFMVLHLSNQLWVPPDYSILSRLEYPLVDTWEPLRSANLENYHMPGSHFNAQANGVIAQTVAPYIESRLEASQ